MYSKLTIAGSNISTFNIMMSFGMLSALLTLLYECSKQKLTSELETKIITAFPFGFLFCAFFAHLFDVFFHAGFFALFSNSIFEYGITFLGCLVAGILYLAIHSKITKINYLYLLNIYLPLFAIAQAWGRIGCFLGGCCFGKPCEFGFSYPENSYPFTVYKDALLFPVQLLESAYLFLVFALIMLLVKFRNRAVAYLLLATSGRFIFEFFRGDDRGSIFHDVVTPSQFLSICLFVFGLVLCFYQKKRKSSIHM